MISSDKAQAVREYAEQEGRTAACEYFGISPETLRRYIRQSKQELDETEDTAIDAPTDRILRDIASRYTTDELKKIAAGGKHHNPQHVPITADWFRGETMRFGVLTDTHIGSKYFRPDWMDVAVDKFAEANLDCIFHVGDVTEGMSNRDDHIYELSHIGYTAQKEAAIEQMLKLDAMGVPLYGIAGNHDLWHVKRNGAFIVEDIWSHLDNGIYLGAHEAEVTIGGMRVKLWHGEDSAQKAHSARVQDIIAKFPSHKRPHVLLTGHDHKGHYFFERGVHAIAAGCLQAQTSFMRYKKIDAMPSFWIVDVAFNGSHVVEFSPTLYPFYEW